MKSILKVLSIVLSVVIASFIFVVSAFCAEEYPIRTKELLIRDPFVLVCEGKYYMYGTGLASGRGYGVVVSEDLRRWSRPKNVFTAADDFDGVGCFWAPECHYYEDAYYLFATYLSQASGKRGVAIFRSKKPDGPFEMITDGHVTPKETDCIDGTLYVDDDGQPWIVYVNEWTSSPDGIGEMAAAKLSRDLTAMVSEPVVLFRANGHRWTDSNVTDGPYVYKSESGALLMLWSNLAKTGGYAVGCARSADGRIDGIWVQQPEAVYKSDNLNQRDGGHGMLFRDSDGNLMMAIHSPNSSDRGEIENARFIPVVDTGFSIESKETYDQRNDLSEAFRSLYLTLYNGFMTLIHQIRVIFSF